jgi:hypothetical protein
VQEVEALKESARHGLEKYVKISRKHGYPADYRMDVATDVVEAATQLCESIVREFPKGTVFTGKLVFRYERFFSRLLHNETAFAIQRRLQWDGITTVILPIRVDMLYQFAFKCIPSLSLRRSPRRTAQYACVGSSLPPRSPS